MEVMKLKKQPHIDFWLDLFFWAILLFSINILFEDVFLFKNFTNNLSAQIALKKWKNMNVEELQIDQRFTAELEFVSSLSNPWYINFLSQQDYFQEEEFINYLDYLLYWKQQPYCQYVNYPIAFYFLDLLQNRSFRESIHLQENVVFLHEKQYYHWLYNKRAKFIIQEMEEGKDVKESKETLE